MHCLRLSFPRPEPVEGRSARRDVVHGLPGSGLSLLPGGGRELLGVSLSIGLASRGRGLAICGGVLPLGGACCIAVGLCRGGNSRDRDRIWKGRVEPGRDEVMGMTRCCVRRLKRW